MNNRGLSVVQMIIGLALMGGMLLAATQLVNTQQKLGKSSSHEFEIIYLADDIRTLLSNPDNCKASFKGRNARRATITALKRVIFPKSGETKREIITAYETYDVSQHKYGQENIAITEISIERDRDSHILGGTSILKVVFDKGKDSLDEKDCYVIRRIKLYMTTSTNLSITSCYTSRGIGLSSSHLPSNQAWTSTPNSKHIYYAGGHVAMGGKDFSSELVLNGELQLAESKLPCDSTRHGALRYNSNIRNLETCHKDNNWGPLVKTGVGQQNPRVSFSLGLAIGEPNGIKESDRIFKICYLKETPIGDGSCEVIGSPDAIWQLRANNDSAGPLNCQMLCHN